MAISYSLSLAMDLYSDPLGDGQLVTISCGFISFERYSKEIVMTHSKFSWLLISMAFSLAWMFTKQNRRVCGRRLRFWIFPGVCFVFTASTALEKRKQFHFFPVYCRDSFLVSSFMFGSSTQQSDWDFQNGNWIISLSCLSSLNFLCVACWTHPNSMYNMAPL